LHRHRGAARHHRSGGAQAASAGARKPRGVHPAAPGLARRMMGMGMNDFSADDQSVERRAEDLAVDGLLRETMRDEAAREDSLERALRHVKTAERPAPPRSFWSWTFRTAAAAALLLIVGILVTDRTPVMPIKLVSGMAVTEGERIVTGEDQKAALELADRSVVRVAENTELVVRSTSGGVQVEMPQGQATFEVTKKAPGKSFEITTAYGQIVVHGT